MELRFDKSIYDRRALLKAAFRFTDRCYIHLRQDEARWIVSWREKDGASVDFGEFENELIAQNLRLQLLEDSAELRKIILARAMASTVIQEAPGPSGEDGATEQDESQILRGWFDEQS